MSNIYNQDVDHRIMKALEESESDNIKIVRALAAIDAENLSTAELSYGDSWKKRGGVGAFMMLARKWDRIENQTEREGYNVFNAIAANPAKTGIIDDIRDLRRYLLLVESEMIRTGVLKDGSDG